MNELENRMVRRETEYRYDYEEGEYDSYINALAERDDKRWEDCEND